MRAPSGVSATDPPPSRSRDPSHAGRAHAPPAATGAIVSHRGRSRVTAARPPGRRPAPARCVGALALEQERGVRIAAPPTTWIGRSASCRRSAASVTPTSGSMSIRIPARVPPIARTPYRNSTDGIPAPRPRPGRRRASARPSRSGTSRALPSASGDRHARDRRSGGSPSPSPGRTGSPGTGRG